MSFCWSDSLTPRTTWAKRTGSFLKCDPISNRASLTGLLETAQDFGQGRVLLLHHRGGLATPVLPAVGRPVREIEDDPRHVVVRTRFQEVLLDLVAVSGLGLVHQRAEFRVGDRVVVDRIP